MDKLIAEEIELDAVPKVQIAPRRITGRIGELWTRFQYLPLGKALAVQCRDAAHFGTTRRELDRKCKAAGMKFGHSRKDNTFYCWRELETAPAIERTA